LPELLNLVCLVFLTLSNTLKTKIGDVVGCIFEVECSVGGFLILKQIIGTIVFVNLWLIFQSIHKVPDPNKAHLIFVFKYRLVKTSKKFGCGL
jgi:hypothetical protein